MEKIASYYRQLAADFYFNACGKLSTIKTMLYKIFRLRTGNNPVVSKPYWKNLVSAAILSHKVIRVFV